MPYIVLSQRLAFQPVDPNDPKMPTGPEEIVERGGEVPAYVPTFTVSALVNSGVIVYAERPDPAVFPANLAPAQPRTPDQPAMLPSDPNGTAPVLADLGVGGEPPFEGDEPAQLPSAADKKEVWEFFAQRPEIGMTQADAESMTKANLMAEVTARYNAVDK